MPPLVGYPFAEAFDFTRPVAAAVRNQAGEVESAAIDEPRFDHDEAGNRLGLLVAAGETLSQGDRCAVIAGDWEVVGPATVLHEYADAEGAVQRRAYYTASVRKMVNSVLAIEGHHRIIGAVPGFLKNRAGEVLYRERLWELSLAIGTGVESEVLEDGSEIDRILVIA